MVSAAVTKVDFLKWILNIYILVLKFFSYLYRKGGEETLGKSCCFIKLILTVLLKTKEGLKRNLRILKVFHT